MFWILSFFAYILLGLASLFLILYIAIPLKRMSVYKSEGRGTYFYPFFGYWKMIAKDALTDDIFKSVKDFGQYTPEKKVMISNVRSKAAVLLRDANYIKEFVQKQQFYHKGDFGKVLLPLMGTGLVLAEGETWKRHRKIISGSFHYEFLKNNIPVIEKTTREFFNKITTEDCKGYSVIPRIQDITGEIVGRIFFGEDLSKYSFEGRPLTLALADLVGELGMCLKSPFVFLFGPGVMNLPIFPALVKVGKKVADFRAICYQIIADRKADPSQGDDLLASLIATQKSEDPSQRFSDEDIVNEFITFFVAGMDTTGHLIGMALYNLARRPQYLEQLKEERDKTFNQEKNVSADTLQKMDALHAILKETLRMHTPASGPFTRVAIENHKLGDLEIKKGDHVRGEFFSVFYNEKYFENPTEFKPERWNNPNTNLDSYSFIPFSAGPRNCIGQHLAIFEAKIIISEFLERFDFKLPEDYNLRMTIRFLYEPMADLKLILNPIKA